MCKDYTGYHGTSEIEHGLCACTVDNPLAKARGLSLRIGAQTMLCLSYVHGAGGISIPIDWEAEPKMRHIYSYVKYQVLTNPDTVHAIPFQKHTHTHDWTGMECIKWTGIYQSYD